MGLSSCLNTFAWGHPRSVLRSLLRPAPPVDQSGNESRRPYCDEVCDDLFLEFALLFCLYGQEGVGQRSFLPFLRLCYLFCLYGQEGPSCPFYGFTSLGFCLVLLQFICVPEIRSTKQTDIFSAPFGRPLVPRRAFDEFGRLLSLRNDVRLSDKSLCH